jgi:probable rRNA maturation factor
MTNQPEPRIGTVAVTIEANGWMQALIDPATLAERAAEATLRAACPDLAAADISVLLADDEVLRSLNREWRGRDLPTNVLSFPAMATRPGETPLAEFAGVPLLLGDIALGFETCTAEAARDGRALSDHLAHLVVHGVLHLLGYDHEDDAAAATMEGLEIRILAGLGIGDPYAGDPLGLEPSGDV